LPAHITSGQTSGGTTILPDGTITWTPIITAPGGVWVETVVVTVETGYAGILTNTVQVTTEEGPAGIYTATTLSLAPDLDISKYADPNLVQAGAQLTYTLRVTNTGNIALNGTITDILPARVARTGILTWTLTNLAPDDVWIKTVVVTVEMGYSGTLVNQVQVTTLEGASGSASATATAYTQVTPALAVTKQASAGLVPAGSPLTYTLRVTNTGDVALNGVVTDTLPANVTPGGILTWSLANLAPGNAWMRTVVVTVTRGYSGTLTNRVQVTSDEGAAGEAQVAVRGIGYQVYLPLVVKQ